MDAAVFELYPALMAACVAFRSIRYSATKRSWRGSNGWFAETTKPTAFLRAVGFLVFWGAAGFFPADGDAMPGSVPVGGAADKPYRGFKLTLKSPHAAGIPS